MPRIGFVLSHEQFRAPQLLQIGESAERAGFDMVWTSDHFHPWMSNQGHSGQAWVTLAALGQRTQRVPFGTGVTCPSYRYHPSIVAQAFASLGVLYPGRVFLGVGAGEALNEQASTSRWGDFAERNERLAEAVELIRALWTGETINHRGKHFAVENAKLYDIPNTPIPIYIAGSGENAMITAGKHGDGLISDTKSITDKKLRVAFENAARKAGKDPAQLPIIAEQFVVVGNKSDAEDAAKLWRFLPRAWDLFVDNPDPRDILQKAEKKVSLEEVYSQWIVSEDPEEHAAGLKKLLDVGVTHLFVHSGQYDQQKVIDFYSREVLPRLR